MKLNKKGMEDEADLTDYSMYFLFGCLFFAGVFAVFIILIGQINSQPVPTELTMSLHIDRFVNNCFPYIDPDTSRKYVGIIDYNRFTEQRLNSCYIVNVNTKSFAYQLTLKATGIDKTIKTSNYDHYEKRTVIPIVIYKDGKFISGELDVDHTEKKE